MRFMPPLCAFPLISCSGRWRSDSGTVGALLFGIVGVIMAVPVALVVKITLALLYDEPIKDALAGK